MKIAIVGAGAVGGYYGARLAAAGHDVAFVARGANLDAIKANGVSVEVVSGLRAGEQVITRGAFNLREGDRIAVSKGEGA